jgi:eukaryotic-like serine/threonine-protein kinase
MNRGLHSAAGIREGDVLAGKYRVERVLGAGGMGVVVAAHHIQLDEKVALKFLLPEALDNAEAVARFAREARAAVKIKNEHVARVTDVGTLPNGAPYMVMEYLEGGDLAAWLKQRGALPIEQAVEFVLQACVAVADAHALGIVHRDLKPANLFCIRRSDGQLAIKVLDFGISKMTDTTGLASGSATRTSALMGSPLYMSPEQMRSPRDVDAQTDIWALGVILFELMAGRPTFLGESVTELAIKVANEPTPPVRSFRPDVPAGLEAIIFKCLEKDRRQRYRNVAELALALLEFGPKRAKASVERITGILQSAGLSESGLAVPPSPQPVAGTLLAPETVAPVGRTATSPARSKTAVLSVVGVMAVAAVLGSAIFLARDASRREVKEAVGSQPPSPAVSPMAPAVGLPKPPDTRLADLAAVADAAPTALPSMRAAPAPTSIPAAEATKKRTPAIIPAAPATATPPQATPTPAHPTPAPAKCDPPYYFDARGNRVFKQECL